MATKKNIDPGRPISRPMAPVTKDPGWGKMLTKEELLGMIDRIHAKQEEQKMSKMSETIAKALAKKQGKAHIESDSAATTEKKVKKAVPAITGRPMKKAAGRGR